MQSVVDVRAGQVIGMELAVHFSNGITGRSAVRTYPAQENLSASARTPRVRSKRTTHLPRAHALLNPHLDSVSAKARFLFQVAQTFKLVFPNIDLCRRRNGVTSEVVHHIDTDIQLIGYTTIGFV